MVRKIDGDSIDDFVVLLEQIDIVSSDLMEYINVQAASAHSPTFDDIQEQLQKFRNSAEEGIPKACIFS